MKRSIARISRGFSMVEILLVVLLLVTVAALLLPVMSSSQRTAKSAICISNLKQLAHGKQLVMTESLSDPGLKEQLKYAGRHWPDLVYSQLNYERLFCPESDFAFGTTSLNQLMIGVHEQGNADKTGGMGGASYSAISYYMELDDSRIWAHKLGWEQYQDYRGFIESETGMSLETAAQNGSSTTAKQVTHAVIDYFENQYHGYEPGEDPDHFVLLLEDYKIIENTTNIAYQNFLDFIIFVEPVPDNDWQVKVTAQHYWKTSVDAGFLVWADNKRPVYEDGTALKPGDNRSLVINKDLGSYGANAPRVFSQHQLGNRILFLDYQHIVANADNWDKWDDEQGVPEFARHLGNTINVAFVDGSVQQMREEEIEPTLYENERSFW